MGGIATAISNGIRSRVRYSLSLYQSLSRWWQAELAAWPSGISEHYPEIAANTLSRQEAIDGYIDLFRSSIKKRIVDGAPIRLPLSGGHDSRHILLELVALGSRPECCYTSCNYTMENDLKIAREVCAALGVPHVTTRSPESEDIVSDRDREEQTDQLSSPSAWMDVVNRPVDGGQASSHV